MEFTSVLLFLIGPKPPHSLIWGHLKLFNDTIKLFPPNTALSVFYTTIAQKYELRGIFYLDLWPFSHSQMVLIAPDAADLVTVRRNYPLHDVVSQFVGPLLGEKAIGGADGETWKMLHRMIAPGFRPSSVKAMMSIIADQTMETFYPALKSYASSGEVFSMENAAGELIFSINIKLILGTSISKQKISELLHDINRILGYAQLISLTSSTNPVKKWTTWWRKRQAAQRIDDFLRSFIAQHHLAGYDRTLDSPDAQGRMTILDSMIFEGRRMGIDSQSSGKLSPAFRDIVVDNVKGLLFGGYGTTTDTLCFVFIMLSLHPHVMVKLRNEHSEVFGASLASTQEILRRTPQKTSELLYTTAVIKETLRLFPVGFGARKAMPGIDALQYNGKLYPTSNHLIIPCTHTIHYDPEVFTQPSRFDPERFMEPNKVPREAWRPFERGARSCIGRDLAMEKLRTVLLLTVRNFDLECASVEPRKTPTAPFTDLDLQLGNLAFQEMALSAKPRGGTMMKVTSR
ncbi:cytochrome P450 [Penicillium cataractarum]|uniref:Cytochrome P450 n=1 Tax=Penicillium cataractarum TaxID=2100454 RepID=A0A9W9RIU6_9EURO|nr:cytochrome P450 [Penicillium cataractarum]KAJ5358348.1 cytochrome P450 [Penicillium cataractarum]